MYATDAIEAINFEQLATATDRLLLGSGRVAARVAARAAAEADPDAAAERTIVVRPRARISAAEASALAAGAAVSAATWLLASLAALL